MQGKEWLGLDTYNSVCPDIFFFTQLDDLFEECTDYYLIGMLHLSTRQL